MFNVNLLAVLASGVASMVIGFVYYHPKVFGDTWMKLVGISKSDIDAKKSEMGKIYGMMFAASLVMAFVLANFIQNAAVSDVVSGIMVGFWAWLGFVATSSFTGVLFEGRPLKLFYISSGYQLVTLLVMGVILTVWR